MATDFVIQKKISVQRHIIYFHIYVPPQPRYLGKEIVLHGMLLAYKYRTAMKYV
jgi:hypothetical protein